MLLVYTDGGSRKKRGAWAYIIVRAPLSSVKTDYMGKLSGDVISYGVGIHEKPLHSSHVELIAAYEGLSRALMLPRSPITLVSDSTYVTTGLAKAHARVNSAQASEKDTGELVRMWRSLLPMYAFNNIQTAHVKGHRKQTGNSFADYLCGEVLTHGTQGIEHKVRLFNNSKIWRSSLIKTRK